MKYPWCVYRENIISVIPLKKEKILIKQFPTESQAIAFSKQYAKIAGKGITISVEYGENPLL